MIQFKDSNHKGQYGLVRVCQKLIEMDYVPFLPFGEPKDKVDLIAKNGNKIITFQVKFAKISSNNNIELKNSLFTYVKDGKLKKYTYSQEDFNYYAIFIPEHNEVIFAPSSLMGKKNSLQFAKM